MEDPNSDDGKFEITIRLLSNEVFGISITADPLRQRWVAGAFLITLLTVVMLSVFSEPLSDLGQHLIYGDEIGETG